MVSESSLSGRPLEGLPTRGSPDCTSELLFVPPVGELLVYRPLSLPLVDLATPIAPAPLERVVDGFLAEVVVVVPQPRYPTPSVSRISEGSSPTLLAPPTTGRVGSLLGLNPYSSTSFRRSSSASFRCLRFRQRKRAAITIKATATTGTTTATAILPPADRPELVEALAPEVVRTVAPVLVDDVFELLVAGIATVGNSGAAAVDVTRIVLAGDWVLPAASVAAGKIDVTICVVGGGTDDTGLSTEDVII